MTRLIALTTLFASPALAHPDTALHGHAPGAPVIAGVALIALAGIALLLRARS